jgi:hypothetical protein
VDICLAQIPLSTNSSRALQGATLIRADLSGAKLSEAKLDAAQLIRTDLRHAELTGSSIYGISAWDVKVDSGTQQRNLIITPKDEPASFGELRAGGGVDGVWGWQPENITGVIPRTPRRFDPLIVQERKKRSGNEGFR